jgi:hypothetical protein
MNVLTSVPGNLCTTGQNPFAGMVTCSVPLRRLQVWSADQTVQLKYPGDQVVTLSYIGNGADNKKGYGAVVVPGPNYVYEFTSLNRAFPGVPVTLEFSDTQYDGQFLPGPDEIKIKLPGEAEICTAGSQHDRAWVGAHGPLAPNRGACRGPHALPATPPVYQRPPVGDDGTGSGQSNTLAPVAAASPPTKLPTRSPTGAPTRTPTLRPGQTRTPTKNPPTTSPTNKPPTKAPTKARTAAPTNEAGIPATGVPTAGPTTTTETNSTAVTPGEIKFVCISLMIAVMYWQFHKRGGA